MKRLNVFLAAGLVAVSGSVLLAACSDDGVNGTADGGTTTGGGTTTAGTTTSGTTTGGTTGARDASSDARADARADSGSTGGTTNSGTTTGGTSGGTTGDGGHEGGATTGDGGTTTGGTTTGGTTGDAGDDGGTPIDDGGQVVGDGGDGGPTFPELNGCGGSGASYVDETGSAAHAEFNWTFTFGNEPRRCLRIKVGNTVGWQTPNGEDFGTHPLEAFGGDSNNPIAANSGTTANINFPTAGTFGFHCFNHGSMQGVILVEP